VTTGDETSPRILEQAARRAGLTIRTARYMHPAQIAHRIRLRAQKQAFAILPPSATQRITRHVHDRYGWPMGFEPIDARIDHGAPSPEANAAGEFKFINQTRTLQQGWEDPAADQLWRYNLHYMEWAWSFANHPDREWANDAFLDLWRGWQDGTRFGRWDAWSPYVASVRTWVMCGVFRPLVSGSAQESPFVESIALHAGYCAANLELDVGGNHLIKNLKALIGAGVFLNDEGLVARATKHLKRQIGVQILSDGGHFERSPSYHCQVLQDLIEIHALLSRGGGSVAVLPDAITKMRMWLGTMLHPDGDVPLFNDSVLVGRDRLAVLNPLEPPGRTLHLLQESGYFVASVTPDVVLIGDIGPPCPDELPAHAHADCLSFEVSVGGRRTIVDTGTSTYNASSRRAYERSTAAHNTVEIDSQDQTEVWGAFRAGARATPTLIKADGGIDEVVVTAEHDGYTRLPGSPRHRRTWTLTSDQLVVTDEIIGSGDHDIAWRCLAAPDTPASCQGSAARIGPLVIALDSSATDEATFLCLMEQTVAFAFGESRATSSVEARLTATLPASIEAMINVEPEVEGA
jgi:hypothetical protein